MFCRFHKPRVRGLCYWLAPGYFERGEARCWMGGTTVRVKRLQLWPFEVIGLKGRHDLRCGSGCSL